MSRRYDEWDDDEDEDRGYRRPSYRRGYREHDEREEKFDASSALRKSMDEAMRVQRDIEDAQARGEHVVTNYKYLGRLPMPAAVGAGLQGLTNIGLGWAGKYLQGHTHTLVDRYAVPYVRNQALIPYLKGGTVLATGLGVLLAEEGIALYSGFARYRQQLAEVAQKVAPVLDEIKKGHGFGAAVMVSRDENEVFYAHRLRLASGLKLDMTKAAIGVGGKAMNIFDIAHNGLSMAGLKQLPTIDKEKLKDGNNIVNVATAGLGSITEFYKDTLEREHKRAHAKSTALELIIDLAEQIKGNPDIDGFEVKGTGRQLPLDQYIAHVFRSHQEEMSRLFPDEYTTIRPALNESLMQASTHIAEAIRKGEVDPLALMRLVGERQIVRNCGRAVASERDVQSVLAHMSGKTQHYTLVSKPEFFTNFTEKDLKGLLDKLQGDERKLAMSLVPESILLGMGFGKKEVHEVHEKMAPKQRQALVAEAVMGLASESPESLHKGGLDGQAIRQVKQAGDAVAEQGVGAISRHLSSGVNPDGVERPLLGSLVEKSIAGDIHYLGKLQKAGRSEMKALVSQEKSEQSVDEGNPGYRELMRRQRMDAAEALGRE